MLYAMMLAAEQKNKKPTQWCGERECKKIHPCSPRNMFLHMKQHDSEETRHKSKRKRTLDRWKSDKAKAEKKTTENKKNKMQPTNPNAHTYVNGTDVETHGYAVTQNTVLQ